MRTPIIQILVLKKVDFIQTYMLKIFLAYLEK